MYLLSRNERFTLLFLAFFLNSIAMDNVELGEVLVLDLLRMFALAMEIMLVLFAVLSYLVEKSLRSNYIHQEIEDGTYVIHTGNVIEKGDTFEHKHRPLPSWTHYIMIPGVSGGTILVALTIELLLDYPINYLYFTGSVLLLALLFGIILRHHDKKLRNADAIFSARYIQDDMEKRGRFVLSLQRIADYTSLVLETPELTAGMVKITEFGNIIDNRILNFFRKFVSWSEDPILVVKPDEYEIIEDRDGVFESSEIGQMILSNSSLRDLEFYQRHLIDWIESKK